MRPENGARVDAIRDAIEERHRRSPLYPILLTSLLEAADRVDSTTGLQMAYLKNWAPRSLQPLSLRVPDLLVGPGRALRADAAQAVKTIGPSRLRLSRPSLQPAPLLHQLPRLGDPDPLGRARPLRDRLQAGRRQGARQPQRVQLQGDDAGGTRARSSPDIKATVVVVSCNDESWLGRDELVEMCACRGHVELLEFDSKRYVGAQIGIHDLSGRKVGQVSHLRNVERLAVCGPRRAVLGALEACSRLSFDGRETAPSRSGGEEGLAMTSSTVVLALAVFGASAVEMVEALTIVTAAGVTRGWRSALEGSARRRAVLAALVLAVGVPLARLVPIDVLRVVIGALLLVLGLDWLRKAVLRASGHKALHDEDAIFATDRRGPLARVTAAEQAAIRRPPRAPGSWRHGRAMPPVSPSLSRACSSRAWRSCSS